MLSFLTPHTRHAHYSLGQYSEAASAFQRGLDVDPSNANLKQSLTNAQARVPGASPPTSTSPPPPGSEARTPDLSALAGMFGGAGGGGGSGAGGGMPDLASLMQNPALMGMAQQMMANGGMERMMQNPAVANMVSSVNENVFSAGSLISGTTLRLRR